MPLRVFDARPVSVPPSCSRRLFLRPRAGTPQESVKIVLVSWAPGICLLPGSLRKAHSFVTRNRHQAVVVLLPCLIGLLMTQERASVTGELVKWSHQAYFWFVPVCPSCSSGKNWSEQQALASMAHPHAHPPLSLLLFLNLASTGLSIFFPLRLQSLLSI